MIKRALAIILPFLMVGCISTGEGIKETVSEVKADGTVTTTTTTHTEGTYYQKGAAKHSESESARIGAQATAIATTVTNANLSADAKGILAYIGIQQIATLTPTAYSAKAPTNGWDVALKVAEQTGQIVDGAVKGTIAVKALDTLNTFAKNAGATNIQASGGAVVTNSRIDNKAVNVGEGQANAGSNPQQAGESEAKTVDSSSNVYRAFDTCSGGLSYEKTLGQVASCMATSAEMKDHDLEIKGGLLYVDGATYAPVNDWEAARPE